MRERERERIEREAQERREGDKTEREEREKRERGEKGQRHEVLRGYRQRMNWGKGRNGGEVENFL